MNNRNSKNSRIINFVCGMGIFSALAYVVAFACQIIPPVAGFLSLDAKDAVIAIASFVYGPVAAPIISLVVAAVEAITISQTGWYGFVMNFASSATFSLVASLIYRYKRSFSGAIIGFVSSIVLTTGVMLLLNIFVTPIYLELMGFPADIFELLPTVLLPFNFAKAVMNSGIAMLLYKPVITALRRARLIESGTKKTAFNKSSVITILIPVAAIALAVTILILLS